MEENISIIVPCFKSSENIKKLLNSLDLENNPNIKCILIDDKSDDDEFHKLEKVIRRYPMKQILLLKNETLQKGAGVCRNIGLNNTNDQWILFADSDDHFVKDYQSIISKYLYSMADMIFFPPISTDELGMVGTRHNTYLKYFNTYYTKRDSSMLKYNLPVVWSRLFKRSFIKKNNLKFDETIISNDRMFSLKAGHYSDNFIVSPYTIYSWDYNRNSLTINMNKERFIVNIEVYIAVNKFLKDKLNSYEYKKVSESIVKFISMSLFRYKFGLYFSLKLMFYLMKNNMPLIRTSDIYKAKSFFEKNYIYK